MEFKLGENVKLYCSKQCSDMSKEKQFASEDSGPAMPPLDADKITDEGCIALVKAIVARAGQDVTKHAPGTRIRVDAENFFKSEFFNALTGLEGEPILRELQEEYRRKHTRKRKKEGWQTRPVRCIETGAEYKSAKEAGEVFCVDPNSIGRSCREGKMSAGMHWEYVGGAANE